MDESRKPISAERMIGILESSIRSLGNAGHGTTDLRIEKATLEKILEQARKNKGQQKNQRNPSTQTGAKQAEPEKNGKQPSEPAQPSLAAQRSPSPRSSPDETGER